MIKRIFVLLACIFWGAVSLSAQSSKLIKELESKRGELQKQIADTESLLKNTKIIWTEKKSMCKKMYY